MERSFTPLHFCIPTFCIQKFGNMKNTSYLCSSFKWEITHDNNSNIKGHYQHKPSPSFERHVYSGENNG